VESIIKLQHITEVPNTAKYLKGVTNLRGSVLPVIDLRARFDLPPIATDKDKRIVVVSIKEIQAGLIVDAVSEVMKLNPAVIEPPMGILNPVDTAYITGIAKVENKLIILLDLWEVIFSHPTPG